MTQLIEITHEFPFSAERWLDLYFSRGFIEHLDAHLPARMKLEILEDKPDTRLRTVRTHPQVELPGFAAAITGGKTLSFLETSVLKKGTNKIEFSVVPNIIPEKFIISGGATVEALTPTTCRRTMRTELTIKVFAVGARLEEFIARSLRESYAKGHGAMIDYERISRPA